MSKEWSNYVGAVVQVVQENRVTLRLGRSDPALGKL